MDPSSALGVVAAVVQFVDFGSRLIQDTREIYKEINGQPTETSTLSVVAEDISALMNDVEQKFAAIEPVSQDHTQRVFIRLCRECNDISQKLKGALSDIQENIDEYKSKTQKREPQHAKLFRTLSDKVDAAVGVTISLKVALTKVWDSGRFQRLRHN